MLTILRTFGVLGNLLQPKYSHTLGQHIPQDNNRALTANCNTTREKNTAGLWLHQRVNTVESLSIRTDVVRAMYSHTQIRTQHTPQVHLHLSVHPWETTTPNRRDRRTTHRSMPLLTKAMKWSPRTTTISQCISAVNILLCSAYCVLCDHLFLLICLSVSVTLSLTYLYMHSSLNIHRY